MIKNLRIKQIVFRKNRPQVSDRRQGTRSVVGGADQAEANIEAASEAETVSGANAVTPNRGGWFSRQKKLLVSAIRGVGKNPN